MNKFRKFSLARYYKMILNSTPTSKTRVLCQVHNEIYFFTALLKHNIQLVIWTWIFFKNPDYILYNVGAYILWIIYYFSLQFTTFYWYFIWLLSCQGPRTDPCGTPLLILSNTWKFSYNLASLECLDYQFIIFR